MGSITLDTNTKSHNYRVELFMDAFLQDHPHLFPYSKELIIAAGIHDIGKHYIPIEILNMPRKLTSEERKIIDWHAYYGYELAKEQGYSDVVCEMVLYHHGADKPKKSGLKISEEIKRHAALLQVIDAYDALTSKRAYHEKISDEKAMAILESSDEYDSGSVALLAGWMNRKKVLYGFAENTWYKNIQTMLLHVGVAQQQARVM